jgi:hypothetical protein
VKLVESDLLMAPDGGMVDPLLQSSLEMRDALCTTPELHLFAEIIPSLPADGTLPAGNAHLESNSVTD